jgi:hypothetical protein
MSAYIDRIAITELDRYAYAYYCDFGKAYNLKHGYSVRNSIYDIEFFIHTKYNYLQYYRQAKVKIRKDKLESIL